MRKGSHHSKETRVKIGLASKGRRHSEETRAEISHILTGKHRSGETKTKLSQSKMGANNPNYGKPLSKDIRAKISLALKGRISPTLGSHLSEEEKAKMSKRAELLWQDPEYRAKVLQSTKLALRDPKLLARRSAAMKKIWLDPEYRYRAVKAVMAGLRIHPNKPERMLLALLESAYPGEWKFVGDGQLIIAGKNPDFFNINSKKQIIELWGDWWHQGQKPQERIDIFKHYGYSTLIIWESELRDPTKVLGRIADFTQSEGDG